MLFNALHDVKLYELWHEMLVYISVLSHTALFQILPSFQQVSNFNRHLIMDIIVEAV